jgi:hypothetical protein
VGNNASAVKIYNNTNSSVEHFENKNLFFYFEERSSLLSSHTIGSWGEFLKRARGEFFKTCVGALFAPRYQLGANRAKSQHWLGAKFSVHRHKKQFQKLASGANFAPVGEFFEAKLAPTKIFVPTYA